MLRYAAAASGLFGSTAFVQTGRQVLRTTLLFSFKLEFRPVLKRVYCSSCVANVLISNKPCERGDGFSEIGQKCERKIVLKC